MEGGHFLGLMKILAVFACFCLFLLFLDKLRLFEEFDQPGCPDLFGIVAFPGSAFDMPIEGPQAFA